MAANANGARCWPGSRRLASCWPGRSRRHSAMTPTELDVRFIAEGSGTWVKLEHRLDGYGAAAEDMFKVFDGGWQGLLESFAEAA
jgi:hypothetical protein